MKREHVIVAASLYMAFCLVATAMMIPPDGGEVSAVVDDTGDGSEGGSGSGTSSCSWGAARDMPTARNSASSATLNGEIYVISGNARWEYGGGRSRAVEAYDPATDTWSVKASVHHPGGTGNAVSLGGYMYFIGGGYHSTYFHDNERYDPATNTWTQMAPMPTARNGIGMAVLGGRIYAIGGYAYHGGDHHYNIVEVYDPVSNTWSSGVPMSQGRAYTSATTLDGKIYALSHVFEVFDPALGYWKVLTSPVGNRISGGSGKSIRAVDGRIFGFSHASTQVYDPVADEWEELEGCAMPTPRSSFTTSVYDDRIYVIGGDTPGTTNHLGANEYLDVSVFATPRLEIITAECDHDHYRYGDAVNVRYTIENVGSMDVENLNIVVDILDPFYVKVAEGMFASGIDIGRGGLYPSDYDTRWTVPVGAPNGEYSVDVAIWDEGGATLYDTESGIDAFSIIVYDLEVPYYYQFGTQWCTLYSMSMIFSYYGQDVLPWDIASDLSKPKEVEVRWGFWGQGNSTIEGYIEDRGLDVEYVFKPSLQTDMFWIEDHIAQGHPIMFSAKPWSHDVAGHSIVITGYHRTDEGGYLHVNDPSGLFVEGCWDIVGGGVDWPFINIEVPLSLFESHRYLWSYFHAISGTPAPVPASISLHDYNAIQVTSRWEGQWTPYMTTLDEGLNWMHPSSVSEILPNVLSFGNAELELQEVFVVNNRKHPDTYEVSIEVERIGGDGGDPNRLWRIERRGMLTMEGHERKDICDAVPAPANPSVDAMSPVDLSNLQTGMYTFSCSIGGDGIGEAHVQIKDLVFAYDIPPYAYAGQDVTILVGEDHEFDGTESHDECSIISWIWDFGDGSPKATGEKATHYFSNPGVYTVTLTVTDDLGVSTSDSMVATVITPSQATEDLINIVKEMVLQKGCEKSLLSKLEAAKDSLDADNADKRGDAANKLGAFVNQVEAQRGKKITGEQADTLVGHAQWVIDNI